ncbi:CubicO group peptidase (beta-lactamase class C family) [Nocardia puris]|uniref:CubicO group peptidase (Beta-lactamase class C family) n=2 Tax=Nocardia puris TaxID=208602 RepID=A0A366DS29_9NOCA|nr:CubicO group peptidase (beta-lactamase class C family) [Nocardia puris]
MYLRRTARATLLTASTLLTAALLAPAAPAAPADCAEPGIGQRAEFRDPGAVGMDAAAVADAIEFGKRTGAHAVQVYRHGCLVGDHTPTGNVPMPLASGSKGVASVAVGRAITLGLFGVDDPLSKFFPTADAAHAGITVRQVLNQTTGIHFSWPADVAGLTTDSVLQNLSAPVEFEPGTTFQYAQNVLALLPEIIEITSGADFQDFVQREVMGPLGIARENWVWLRDRSGNTAVNGGLAMRPDDLARIGRLLLQEGTWGGQQLIDPGYIRRAASPSEANGGYGFLWWLNASDTYRGVNVPMPKSYDHPVFVGSPRDMYAFSGALGQFLVMVPSRDLVIVRLGVPASLGRGDISSVLTGTANPDNPELFRRLSAAVTDVPATPYRDPYAYADTGGTQSRTPEELAQLADPMTVAQILLGAGPYASAQCNVLWCDGRLLPQDVFRLILDTSHQIAAANAALGNTPR